MTKRNIIIISLDEVRPDHLSCYGYKKINTPAIDQVAREGVRFETCTTSSCFTPVAMSSVITGKYPNKHGMRDPYSYLIGPSIATILKKYDYKTAGFVGNSLLSKKNGFAEGFDFYNESSEETSWEEATYKEDPKKTKVLVGNYWVEKFFKWLNENYEEKFFIWGHLLETHEGSENYLLKKGLIKEGELSEFGYYDAKIKMTDEKLINRLINNLKELDIYENTTLVIMSDHGTNLGEHPAPPICYRETERKYPQHMTMYDCDLKNAMIIKGEKIPKDKIIYGMVRSIDLIPTLLDLIGVKLDKFGFDGESLLPVIRNGVAKDRILYAEDIFEPRGPGIIQAIRDDYSKYMRNLTKWTEEYYDLSKDPNEKNNIIGKIESEKILKLRKKLNSFLISTDISKSKKAPITNKEKSIIDERLRRLGYIE
ncbi:MAG: sulfatase [Bacteroidales bacterium]|nr:sulfatase [Bacteroidales bacterium]